MRLRHVITGIAAAFVIMSSMTPNARAVTRADAANTVINDIILPHPEALFIMAYGPQTPVIAGETLEDGYAGREVTPVFSSAWLFWLDISPDADFGHPTTYVLVDETTGAITQGEGQFWPKIGGIDYLRSDDIRNSSHPDIIYVGPEAESAIPPHTHDFEGLRTSIQPFGGPDSSKWAIIISGEDTLGNAPRRATVDSARAVFTGALGVPIANVTILNNASKATICTTIDNLAKKCPKMYVFFTGHGLPGRLFSGPDSLLATELASKLKGLQAEEYCTFLCQCFSGSFLPVFRDSGLTGTHMSGANSSLTSWRRTYTATKFPWIGNVFAHYILGCLRAGLTGQAAYRCARDSVTAYVGRRHKTTPPPHDSKPQSSQVFQVTDGGGAIEICPADGQQSVCINWKPGRTEVCGNATLYCQVIPSPGTTTWVAYRHWNWNLGKSRYFRVKGDPLATGKYRLVHHSNSYPVCGDITFADTLVTETPNSSLTFPAYALGWRDQSNFEFGDQPFLPGIGFQPGLPLEFVPGWIGNRGTGFNQLDVFMDLQIDPGRPWLYQAGDPFLGYSGNTVLLLESSGIFDPFGTPLPALEFQLDFQQGFFSESFSVNAFFEPVLGQVFIEPVDLGPILPEPFRISLSQLGSGAIGTGGYMDLDNFLVHTELSIPGVGVPKRPAGPVTRLELSAPWPNPSGGGIYTELALPRSARVNVEVFDLNGRLVSTIADQVFEAGTHSLEWRGTDRNLKPVPSGVYFMRAMTPGRTVVRKMIRMH